MYDRNKGLVRASNIRHAFTLLAWGEYLPSFELPFLVRSREGRENERGVMTGLTRKEAATMARLQV